MVANNIQKKPPRAPTPMEHVRAQLAEHLAGLLPHFHVDGTWLWYCGPSLQKFPEARQFLKDLGFRFAFKGHLIKGTKHVGTWGHSCMAPTPFRRRRGSSTAARSRVTDETAEETETTVAPVALFAELGL